MRDLKVFKIGGSLLKNGRSYEIVAEEIRRKLDAECGSIVTVVSAINGVTDELISVFNGSMKAFENVVKKYVEAANYVGGLELRDKVANELFKLRHVLEISDRHDASLKDFVLSFGEKISKMLLVSALENIGVEAVGINATEIVKTNSVHGNAQIKYEETFSRLENYVAPLLSSGNVVVIEGFVGSTFNDKITTLGRGGSDYTATSIAALLKAREVRIITNVPGIMSADPKYVKSAHVVSSMSYSEAMEASFYGCKRLHPRTFQPLRRFHRCNVIIGSWNNGTVVSEGKHGLGPKLVTFKNKGECAHVALIGENVSSFDIVSEALYLLRRSRLRYEGIYAFTRRPSLVFLFRNQMLSEVLNVLHKMIVKGG